MFPIFLPHFRLYELASLHMCVLPFKYRKILGMLPELIKLCELLGSRYIYTDTEAECLTLVKAMNVFTHSENRQPGVSQQTFICDRHTWFV